MLIDGGESTNAEQIDAYIARLGVPVNHLLTSHYDGDHSGGVVALLIADNVSAVASAIAETLAKQPMAGPREKLVAGFAAAACPSRSTIEQVSSVKARRRVVSEPIEGGELRVLLTVCGVLVALAAPAGAVASAPPVAKPTAKAPWKFSDKSLPLSASFDGKKLKVIATVKGACEEGELNFVKATYPINASIPVSNREFDADVIVTDSNGKKRSLLLRGKVTKETLSITISASFKEAGSCIIGGNKNSVKRDR